MLIAACSPPTTTSPTTLTLSTAPSDGPTDWYANIFCVKIFSRVTVEVVGREGEPVSVSALIDGGQPWRRGYGGNVVYTDWARQG